MKTTKKLLALLLTVIMLVTSVPIGMVANAARSSYIQDVTFSVSQDKTSYNWGDDIYFDVHVTNNSDETLNNVKVYAEPKKALLFNSIAGSGSVIIPTLAPGETKLVELMYNAEKISLFTRLFLVPFQAFWGFFFNLGGYGEVRKVKVGMFNFRFGFDVKYAEEGEEPVDPDDPTDTNATISIDQDNFTTNENVAIISGTFDCDNLENIQYEVSPFSYETSSSTIGDAIIDGNNWEASILLKPGKNVVNVSVIKNNGYKKTETIEITYDFIEQYEYTSNDISVDEETETSFINNIIVVYFTENATQEAIDDIVNSLDGEIAGVNYLLKSYQIRVQKSSLDELKELIDEISYNEYVAHADYDELIEVENISVNDPWNGDINSNDWLDTDVDGSNWSMEAVEAAGAWEHNDRLSNIKVGVVDNGFANHIDLNRTVLSTNSVDSGSHGTHVAGTINATANNSEGCTGVMYNNAELLCYDVSPTPNNIITSEIYNGISTLVAAGAKVINISMGAKYPELTDIDSEGRQASINMANLLNQGYDFVIVQSAGNKSVDAIKNSMFCSVTRNTCATIGNITADDILDRIIVVAAAEYSNDRYSVCDFSCGGSQVTIAAPGRSIYSTISTNSYSFKNGTSMAAPMVTGIAAMVWSVNPDFTGSDVKDILVNSTSQVAYDNPSSTTGGDFKLVNAKLAVEEAIKRTDAHGTLKLSVVDAENGNTINSFKLECTDYEGFGANYEGEVYNNANNLQLPAGKYTFKITSNNYIQKYFDFEIVANAETSVLVMLSNELGDNNVRVIMQWGTENNYINPSDLDSHFYGTLTDGSSYHVYYREMGDHNIAWLDIDDTYYVGPETITLDLSKFKEFTYSIHNFSHRHADSNSEYAIELAKSQVVVKIVVGEQEVGSFEVPTNRKGTVWNVFRMQNDGTITKINTFEYISEPDLVGSTIN